MAATVNRPALPSPPMPSDRRPHFGPRRRTRASLVAPPARFAHAATAYGNADNSRLASLNPRPLDQKRVKPRLEEACTHRRSKKPFPSSPERSRNGMRAARGNRARRRRDRLYRVELRLAHPRLLGRSVAKPGVPHGRPDQPHALRTRRRMRAIHSGSGSARPAAARWLHQSGSPSAAPRPCWRAATADTTAR